MLLAKRLIPEQLLRQVRRFQPDLGQQFGDRLVPGDEEFEDPDPRRVPQRLEELGLDLVQRLRHGQVS